MRLLATLSGSRVYGSIGSTIDGSMVRLDGIESAEFEPKYYNQTHLVNKLVPK